MRPRRSGRDAPAFARVMPMMRATPCARPKPLPARRVAWLPRRARQTNRHHVVKLGQHHRASA